MINNFIIYVNRKFYSFIHFLDKLIFRRMILLGLIVNILNTNDWEKLLTPHRYFVLSFYGYSPTDLESAFQ